MKPNQSKIEKIIELRFGEALKQLKIHKCISIQRTLDQAKDALYSAIMEEMPKEEEAEHDEDGEKCGCKYMDEGTPCENEIEGHNRGRQAGLTALNKVFGKETK